MRVGLVNIKENAVSKVERERSAEQEEDVDHESLQCTVDEDMDEDIGEKDKEEHSLEEESKDAEREGKR